MKKKLISMLLCAAMVGAMLTGCGSSPDTPSAEGGAASGGSGSAEAGGEAEKRCCLPEAQQPAVSSFRYTGMGTVLPAIFP